VCLRPPTLGEKALPRSATNGNFRPSRGTLYVGTSLARAQDRASQASLSFQSWPIACNDWQVLGGLTQNQLWRRIVVPARIGLGSCDHVQIAEDRTLDHAPRAPRVCISRASRLYREGTFSALYYNLARHYWGSEFHYGLHNRIDWRSRRSIGGFGPLFICPKS
jgi:hypothetical protein